MKDCNNPACEQSNPQPFENFYKKPRHVDYSSSAGYTHLCRKCTKVERKLYVKANKGKVKGGDRDYKLRVEYGITLADYTAMFNLQEGKCKGCGRHQSELKRPLCVDHCHKTNKIRGLLCVSCNLILGYALDNTKVLKNLIDYLQAS